MVANIRVVERRLTKRIRFRRGFFGSPVVQVEEVCTSVDLPFKTHPSESWMEWRDAKLGDVQPYSVFVLS